jgi:hypothetical protein
MKPLPDYTAIDRIKKGLRGPLRSTEKGTAGTIAAYIDLARRCASMKFPDTDKVAIDAAVLKRDIAMLPDTMTIPVFVNGPMTYGKLREVLDCVACLNGPSSKTDTEKKIIAEVAAGMVQELKETGRPRAYRRILSDFYEAVTGRWAALRHQSDVVIDDRWKSKNS